MKKILNSLKRRLKNELGITKSELKRYKFSFKIKKLPRNSPTKKLVKKVVKGVGM